MPSKKIYIGSVCNRDEETFKKIKKFCKQYYYVSIENLSKKGVFSVKYLKKKLKKYPISLIIVKLLSQESNDIIYKTLDEICPDIPRLNSLDSIRRCESRKATFEFVEKNCKKVTVPKTFYSLKDAFDAFNNGTKIIIKLDVHNAPNLSKYDRIVGIANNSSELNKYVEKYKESELFFQEYLGMCEKIYKVYVIDRWVVCITSNSRLQKITNLSPLELVHIRVPVEKQLKRRIRRLGRKLGMSIFGVDYILKDGVPYIIDINDFPSFRNVPEGISLISDYIYNLMITRKYAYRALTKAKTQF